MCTRTAKGQLLASTGDAHSELQISALTLQEKFTNQTLETLTNDAGLMCYPGERSWGVSFSHVGKFHLRPFSFVNDDDFT